jgi:hypothetical protein
VAWEGRGENGRPLGAGVYWARMEVSGRVFSHRVVVMP